MLQPAENSRSETRSDQTASQQLVVFYVGDFICAVPVSAVQEINKDLDFTAVHQAPSYVEGITNLRGQIVTVVSLRDRLGLDSKSLTPTTRNVVVRWNDELVGLLVDDVADIIEVDRSRIHKPPPHIDAAMGSRISGVYQLENDLLAILDVEKLLAISAA